MNLLLSTYDQGVILEDVNLEYFVESSVRSDWISLSSVCGLFTGRLIVFSMVLALSILRVRIYVDEDGGLGDVLLVITDTSTISQSCVEVVSVENDESSIDVESESSRDDSGSFEFSLLQSLEVLSLFARCDVHLADASLAVR